MWIIAVSTLHILIYNTLLVIKYTTNCNVLSQLNFFSITNSPSLLIRCITKCFWSDLAHSLSYPIRNQSGCSGNVGSVEGHLSVWFLTPDPVRLDKRHTYTRLLTVQLAAAGWFVFGMSSITTGRRNRPWACAWSERRRIHVYQWHWLCKCMLNHYFPLNLSKL